MLQNSFHRRTKGEVTFQFYVRICSYLQRERGENEIKNRTNQDQIFAQGPIVSAIHFESIKMYGSPKYPYAAATVVA